MLVELSVVEQRYHAVMEVISGGVPVVEVAERYGVSRKTVHAWLRRYRQDGLPGLADRSHRPHHHPGQLAADVEARVCELRRAHPRWGPRRLVYELHRLGVAPVPSRSTVYRVLVRHSLVGAIPRKRRRQDYRRWERSGPMQLWQLDVMGSVLIKDPAAPGGIREAKLISGIDDHSRYSVIGTVVARATARAVCTAFMAAMAEYGVPEEVLSDNGRQFTGRFGAPRPAEVLFERICRHNGVTQRLTKPRSPTTTGKVERWHQTIQDELLDPLGPFDSLEAAQAAVDAWRTEYNTLRPHQSLDMATPAERFAPVPVEQRAVLGLWRPPELAPTGPSCEIVDDLDAIDDEPDDPAPTATDPLPAPGASTAQQLAQTHDPAPDIDAVEIDRLVPASGNLGICGQQFWLGPARAGRTLTLWIDTTTVHLSLDGQASQDPAVPADQHRPGPATRPRRPPRRPTAAGTTVVDPTVRRRTRRNPPQRQRRGHGLHRRSLPLRRPTIRRPANHPAPGNHRRPRHHRRDARPDHPPNPDPDPTRPTPRRPSARPCSAAGPATRSGPAHGVLPRRHPDHRPTGASRAALCRTDRDHRGRRDHPAGLRPPRPFDQK